MVEAGKQLDPRVIPGWPGRGFVNVDLILPDLECKTAERRIRRLLSFRRSAMANVSRVSLTLSGSAISFPGLAAMRA